MPRISLMSKVKKYLATPINKKVTHKYLLRDAMCNVCGNTNTEFIEYINIYDATIMRCCQSCVSKQFRLFSKEIKSYKKVTETDEGL